MNIPSNADVQMKRRFSVDIASCNNMRKRHLSIENVDCCMWLEVPQGNSKVLISVHILVPSRDYRFGECDLVSKKLHEPGVTLMFENCYLGKKYSFLFHDWDVFESFLGRLPKSLPSGKVTYIMGMDGSPKKLDHFLKHLAWGMGTYISASTSASALKNLRRHMRNLGIAA